MGGWFASSKLEEGIKKLVVLGEGKKLVGPVEGWLGGLHVRELVRLEEKLVISTRRPVNMKAEEKIRTRLWTILETKRSLPNQDEVVGLVEARNRIQNRGCCGGGGENGSENEDPRRQEQPARTHCWC